MAAESQSEAQTPACQWLRLRRSGEADDVRRFVNDKGELTLDEIVGVLLVEMRECWQMGERIFTETFFLWFPELHSNAESAVELIYEEFLLRRQLGDDPALQEYQQRFPSYAEWLARQFDFHQALSAASKPSTETLDHFASQAGSSAQDFEAHAESASAAWELPGGRYRVLGEIARGGMGVVLRALDVDLQRPLAIKVMLDAQRHADREERFLEEARITGQLQHPGIPPVYEIGRLSDGRPLFAMKMIEGRTLAELLKARPTPQSDVPRFLKIFEQIVQTLGYAHSRGVIHRDLKPANVMVGAFGEVQVMDWGLARRLGPSLKATNKADTSQLLQDVAEPASADATLSHAIMAADSAATPRADDRLTQAGQVLGTPAFMAPEQARGEIDELDERADVFGLGAILCVILTGTPPYAGRDAFEVLQRAQRADLADALQRLADCGADAELVALAKRCLAAQPDARPGAAGDVAAKLTAYLESVETRLRQAELERAQAQLKAQEERKRRRLTLAWSLTGAVAVTLMIAGWLWFQYKFQAQEIERRQIVVAAADKADDLAAQMRWKDAELVLDQAVQRLGEGGSYETRSRLKRSQREIRLLADLDEARMARSQATAGTATLDPMLSSAAYERAFTAFGLDVLRAEPAQLMQQLGKLRPELRRATAVALDDWMYYCNPGPQVQARLHPLASALDDDPWRQRFRQADGLKGLEEMERETLKAEVPATSLCLLALALNRYGAAEAGTRVLRRAVRHYPGDFWAHFYLARMLYENKDPRNIEERIAHLRAAIVARPRATAAHNDLGLALHVKGDLEGAIAAYRLAIQLDPSFACYTNLCGALRASGQNAAALAAARKALEMEPRNTVAYYNLGLCLRANKDLEGAIAAYRQAITLNPRYSEAHTNLGNAIGALGDKAGSIAAYRQAIAVGPNNVKAHYNLGNGLRAQGDLPGAAAAYRKAIELDGKLPEAHWNLGLVLLSQGQFSAALAALRRGHELNPQVDDADEIRNAERLLDLEPRLPAVLKGEVRPANVNEWRGYLKICEIKRLYAGAARLYGDSFAAEPDLATDLKNRHRYNAAVNAALAGCGQGADAASLDDTQRRAWRKQALDWLAADLKAWSALLASDGTTKEAVAIAMAHWQADPNAACFRDESWLERIPASEQSAWRRLWADVAALRQRSE